MTTTTRPSRRASPGTDRAACARVRLAALAVLAALLSLLACRPVWSPDGKQLLFPASLGAGRVGIARYDRDTGAVELVSIPPGKEGRAAALWTPDGKGAVVLAAAQARAQALEVAVHTMPPSGPPRTFAIAGNDEHPVAAFLAAPVLVGRQLFTTADGIVRLDLDTGAQQHLGVEAADHHLAVVPLGDGVGYVSQHGELGDWSHWELGTLDPTTLQRTPSWRSVDHPDWRIAPLPAFSRDLARLALPAVRGDDQAILVFADGKLEAALPLGTQATVGIHALAWSADGATIYASLSRRAAGRPGDSWSLYETTVGGSVARDTPLFTTPRTQEPTPPTGQLGLALSPDGKTMALSTAYCPLASPADAGLYLVDLAHKERKVTKVPFPARTLRLAGSDVMLALAERWGAGFEQDHPGGLVETGGGGTGAGLAALQAGTCDLAMSTRALRPADLAQATARGVALVPHHVASDALAVVVHKDNPMASISVEQLAQAFGADGATRWAELGVTLPAAASAITAVGPPANSAAYGCFRAVVLGSRAEAPGVTHLQGARDLVAFVRDRPSAIGCVAFAHADDTVKVLPVAKAAGPAVPATAATVADGSYPLAQPLYLVLLGEPKPAVAAFLQWLASEPGRKATMQAGFLPAR